MGAPRGGPRGRVTWGLDFNVHFSLQPHAIKKNTDIMEEEASSSSSHAPLVLTDMLRATEAKNEVMAIIGEDTMTTRNEEEEKEFHWTCDVEKMTRELLPHPSIRTAMMCNSCKNIGKKILQLSHLSATDPSYARLESVLSFLQFKKEASAVDHHDNLQQKFPAIVAGSYPAYLGKALRKYADVDVFVVVTKSSIRHLAPLWNVIYKDFLVVDWLLDYDIYVYYEHMYKHVLSVAEFGKVQIILRYYAHGCLCDHHINTEFFKEFHPCTRWKLDVYRDYVVPRYMHTEGGERGNIISTESAVTPLYDEVLEECGGKLVPKTVPRQYPNKHVENVLDLSPPRLGQQALHVLLRKPIPALPPVSLSSSSPSTTQDCLRPAPVLKIDNGDDGMEDIPSNVAQAVAAEIWVHDVCLECPEVFDGTVMPLNWRDIGL